MGTAPPKFEQLEPPRPAFARYRWIQFGTMAVGVGLVLGIGFHIRWAYFVFTLPGAALDLVGLYYLLRKWPEWGR
jgi:hypothetical protein